MCVCIVFMPMRFLYLWVMMKCLDAILHKTLFHEGERETGRAREREREREKWMENY